MVIQLPVLWLIAVNVLAWLFIHMGVAWLGTQLPYTWFRADSFACRIRAWERRSRVYERVFGIRSWKDRLPDGAALFRGGFRKRSFNARDPEYIERFIRETCRGEVVHWVVMASALLFFLWNPWWAGLIMVAYGIIANLPCILAQRYNRARLLRLANVAKAKPADVKQVAQ